MFIGPAFSIGAVVAKVLDTKEVQSNLVARPKPDTLQKIIEKNMATYATQGTKTAGGGSTFTSFQMDLLKRVESDRNRLDSITETRDTQMRQFMSFLESQIQF